MDASDVAAEYYKIYQSEKSVRAESRVLQPLGLTLDTFVQRQNQMNPSFISDVTREIVNFDMPPIEAIITGVDDDGAHIYVVGNSGVDCKDPIGFAAIGVGYWHANSQFMFARHTRFSAMPKTLFLTFAAKRRAEVAPGVGEGTDMFSIGPAAGTYTIIDTKIVDDLDKIYRRARDRSDQSINKANEETNKYVEKLEKQRAAQRQQAPPQPTTADRPNGETGTAGEEDSKKSKPN